MSYFHFIQFSLPSALSSFKSLFYFCSLLPAPPPLVPSITLPARPFTSPPAPLLLILHLLVLPLLLVMFAHRLNAIRWHLRWHLIHKQTWQGHCLVTVEISYHMNTGLQCGIFIFWPRSTDFILSNCVVACRWGIVHCYIVHPPDPSVFFRLLEDIWLRMSS